MRAAYTSALAVTLLQHNMHFGFVSGISAGATNTANYVARQPIRARRSFVEFSTDPNMGSMRTWLRGKGMFNAEYIYEQTYKPGGALPYDFNTFINSPAQVQFGAVEMTTGDMVWWGKEHIHHEIDLMKRVRASSTMPIIMPPVTIGSGRYVDGAIGPDGGVPLSTAIDNGYKKFVVVLTQEDAYRKTPERFPRMYQAVFRKYPAVADLLITRWRRYNETKEKLFALRDAGQAYLFIPEEMNLTNSEKNLRKLRAAHAQGLAQAAREIDAIKEFVGFSPES